MLFAYLVLPATFVLKAQSTTRLTFVRQAIIVLKEVQLDRLLLAPLVRTQLLQDFNPPPSVQCVLLATTVLKT